MNSGVIKIKICCRDQKKERISIKTTSFSVERGHLESQPSQKNTKLIRLQKTTPAILCKKSLQNYGFEIIKINLEKVFVSTESLQAGAEGATVTHGDQQQSGAMK